MLNRGSTLIAAVAAALGLAMAATIVAAQPPGAQAPGRGGAQAPGRGGAAVPGRGGAAAPGRAGGAPASQAKPGYVVPPENSAGLYPVSGEPIFKENCASCHDPALDRAPSKQELSARGPEEMYDILKTGVMAPMASGLSEADIYGVIRFLTGKSPTPNVARAADPNKCAAANRPLQPNGPSWNGWSPDVANSRYQPNPGIRAADVPRLKEKWAFSYPGTKNTEPLVFGDRVYVASMGGMAYSLDTRTGCVFWRFDFGGGTRASMTIGRLASAPSGYAIYISDDRMHVRALDARSGVKLWEVTVDDHKVGRITGSPTLYNGVLYVPLSFAEESQGNVGSYNCCTAMGTVVAVDVRDGHTIWKTRILDTPSRPTRKNSAGTQMFGPAGGSIWSAPTIDAKRGQLYVATGDSFTEISHPTSDAVVAMDLRTGRIKWTNQVLANDNFMSGTINGPTGPRGPDYDFGQNPILLRTPEGRELVVTGNKSSIVYGMDPDTGRTLWTSRGANGEQKLGLGGASGGIMWGSAYDGRYYYTALADGQGPPRGNPGIFAIDVGTGRTVWHTPAPVGASCNVPSGRCSARFSGALTAIPGAVFAGGMDGHLRAFESGTGRIIWDVDTALPRDTVNGIRNAPGGAMDMGGPVFAGGMMFVHSGYNGSAGANDVLLAYTVDGK